MKHLVAILIAIVVGINSGTVCWGEEQNALIETQVLRVFATKKAGYYHKPWKSPDFANLKASGFFFKDEQNFPNAKGLILTNAHAVSQAQSIKVSNGREKRRYPVKLLGICDSADFAVLQMDEAGLRTYEERNGKVVPLELGDSDKLRVGDKVMGWGYPLGGERISKSEQGEINRIEVNRYAHSGESWLMIQASLQQNRGNSGGPVLKDGKVVGVAFQGLRTADRINYFIPIGVVKRLMPLLWSQEKIPYWRYIVQFMFPRLKAYFNLTTEDGGVLLDYIIPGGGPYRFGLRADDILTEIDGHPIDNYGDIFFAPLGQRVYFGEVLKRKVVGDDLTVKLIRGGKTLDITGKVTQGLPRLVSRVFTDPNYFVLGGVGFVELTLNCIDNLGKTGGVFRAKYVDRFPKRPYEKIVIISEIFPEYGLVDSSGFLQRVKKINDEEVLNLQSLYDTIESLKARGEKRAILRVGDHTRLPLDLERAAELDARIKDKYGILYMKTPGGFRK
jgi:S1-C subfamily serine protease